MIKNTMIFIFFNMIYLLIWHATNKIRSTKVGKELDNGFEFYIYLLIWHATNKIRSTKVGKELDNGFEFYNSLNT
ncbi:hypothetical protein, partial [Holdemanella porci]|uniref:hypothetical protein n=1 Tax=Holdemanella porci TaxID=2652276 RepID=UPI0022E24D58